jgi:hypothetical protein
VILPNIRTRSEATPSPRTVYVFTVILIKGSESNVQHVSHRNCDSLTSGNHRLGGMASREQLARWQHAAPRQPQEHVNPPSRFKFGGQRRASCGLPSSRKAVRRTTCRLPTILEACGRSGLFCLSCSFSFLLFYVAIFMSDSGTPLAYRAAYATLATSFALFVGAVWGILTGNWIGSLLPSLAWLSVFLIRPGVRYSCIWLWGKLAKYVGRG